MKKVSVIIPMYNAENTIEECLDSLIAQTIFGDMELVIVDDCSADSSVSKVLKYEQCHEEHITVICLDENKGPGNARNIAMEYATGEYIGFTDSDDAVYPFMYEKLYNEAIKTNADFVDGGFYDQKKDTAIVYTSDELKGELNDHKRSELIVSGGYIWSRIYRRDFLREQNIRFREEYVLEDMDYLIEAIAKAHIISNVKEILYVYRDSTGSLSKTVDVDKYLHSTISAMKAVYDRTSGLYCYEGICDSVEYAILQLYSYSINIILRSISEEEITKYAAIETLEKLRDLKLLLVGGNYENKYIKNKISTEDVFIMKENDRSPKELLTKIAMK